MSNYAVVRSHFIGILYAAVICEFAMQPSTLIIYKEINLTHRKARQRQVVL